MTGHPDWGKIFGDYNGQIKFRTKQKYKFLSATLSRCALLHCLCELKATQMTVLRSQIRKLMLHEFEIGNNAVEATKKLLCRRWRRSLSEFSKQIVQ